MEKVPGIEGPKQSQDRVQQLHSDLSLLWGYYFVINNVISFMYSVEMQFKRRTSH